MADCFPEKDYVTRGWHKLSTGDNPSYHTLTRLIIVLLHRISYSAIIIWSSSNLTTDAKWWPFARHRHVVVVYQGKLPDLETCEAHKGIFMGVFLHAVDIIMRPNVQQLFERNVKCHVTFFRLIKFKIYTSM
jgi:hypothetical protein